MKKFLLLVVFIFLMVASVAFAQEMATVEEETTTTTVAVTTTVQNKVTMPIGFSIGKWFLELRKVVTTNSVARAKIENQIIERDEKMINKLLEGNKIEAMDKIIANHIQRRDNALSQLEKLKQEGNDVSDLINKVKSNAVDPNSVLFKRLEKATDKQKANIVANLEKRQENIQKRIEVKEGLLQNAKTDEEIQNLKEQVTLLSEERKQILNSLMEMVKEKLMLMNENQKSHFTNYLRLRISKLAKEGLEEMKSKIADGSIRGELESIMAKIVQYNKPVINIEKKEIIKEKVELNQQIREEKKDILETAKEKFSELKDLKIQTLTPEQKQKIVEDAKKAREESVEKLKQLNEEKNRKLQEMKDKMNSMQKPAKPITQTQEALDNVQQ